MPELPEVETVVKSLSPIIGQKITSVNVYNRQLRIGCIIPDSFEQEILASSIKNIYRIAKYIVIELSPKKTMIAHLGMAGNLLLKKRDYTPQKHEHVHITLDSYSLIYKDPRRFGAIYLIPTKNIENFFKSKNMGIDALSDDFSPKYLYEKLKGRKTPIKTSLLNQEIVAGLGNIYVCEALFLTKINPCKESHALSLSELKNLVSAIKSTLKKAIKAGGTTLKDHKNAKGTPGYFSQELLVYGKENQACPNCKNTVKRIVIGGRSTFFCPTCQK